MQAKPSPYLADLSYESEVGLADLLPTALIERALSSPTLIMVPHGALHLLPWATLTVNDRRLFDTTAVGLLPNLSCMSLLDVEPLQRPRLAFMGNPLFRKHQALKYMAEEPTKIGHLYGDRLLLPPITGVEATSTAFWELAARDEARTAVLHLSSHGTLEWYEPLASGLVMTDSTIAAAELITRRCHFPEVVLSACSTGWRPQSVRELELVGDDALGLVASFLEAGARFVLASVPPVQEKTALDFTMAWHSSRLAGSAPLAASRSAQQQLAARAPNEVYLWSGMSAYGCR